MLTKAIVEQIIDKYSAKVRVPMWDEAYGTSEATPLEELPIATICANTGVLPVLAPGEVVYVEFENTRLDEPVILGTLVCEKTGSAADVTARSLTVEVDCHFPQQFWDQIDDYLMPRFAEIQNQLDNSSGVGPINYETHELFSDDPSASCILSIYQQDSSYWFDAVFSKVSKPTTFYLNNFSASIISIPKDKLLLVEYEEGGNRLEASINSAGSSTYGSIAITVPEGGVNHFVSAEFGLVSNNSAVYGVEWDFSKTATTLTRLTAETDPNRYVTACPSWEPTAAIGTGSGFSPFDDIAPWKDMKKYKFGTDEYYVRLPKYWYKYDLDTKAKKLRIYISNTETAGFILDDRSNYYIGRYSCDSSYKSRTGQSAKISETRQSFRQHIANRDSTNHTFFQYDMSTLQSLWRLYIIEFANWDSEKTIGAGAVSTGGVITPNGTTDSMVYHTGTVGVSRNDTTASIQYRNIENPFGNVDQFLDGVNFYNRKCYYCTNPMNFTDDTSDNYIDTNCVLPDTSSVSKYTKQLSVSNDEKLLVPSMAGGSNSTYIPDYLSSATGWKVASTGGNSQSGKADGLFRLDANNDSLYYHTLTGARACIAPSNQSLVPLTKMSIPSIDCLGMTDGTYTLKATITNGVINYEWVKV